MAGSLAWEGGVEEDETAYIIPGLPDDLSLQILAQIPFAHQASAKAVCRRWLDALSSGTVYQVRNVKWNIWYTQLALLRLYNL